MTEQELDFLGFQHLDESSIVIKMATVCGGSGTPFIGVHKFEPGG